MNLFVVETTDDLLIGSIEFGKGTLVVRNGFVGRPTVVQVDDLVSIRRAEDHPEVES